MKKTFQQKSIIVQIVVVLGIMAVLSGFILQKEGYHMDELISFELSNAEFNPWIVSTQPVGRLAKFVQEEIRGASFGETLSNLADTVSDVIVNRGKSRLLQYKADVYPEPVWISRRQFRDYLTTDDTDRFQYLSVYFNIRDDTHPPLYYILLHTMSSLFPGTISPFLGCAVNLAAMAVCILCLFRLGNLLESRNLVPSGCGNAAGICMGLLYGLSAGAIATVLLIRMYGVMTCFCILTFYLHLKKWLDKGFETKNKFLAAVTVSGFLTQYFFLFYCLMLAGVTAGLLITKKRYGELKGYLRTMIISAVVGVALFPFSIQHILSGDRGTEALQNLEMGFSGYGTRLAGFGNILLKACTGSVILGILLCIYAVIRRFLFRCGRRDRASGERAGQEFPLWLMLVLPCCCYFFLASRMSPYLVDRYIMPLFPFMAIIVTLVSVRILEFLPRVGFYWILLPAFLLGVVSVICYDGKYLYQGYDEQLEIAGEYGELPCICLYDGVGFYYNLMEFTEYKETLLLKPGELEERENREDITRLQQVIIVRKNNVEETRTLEILRSYGLEVTEVLLKESESVYGDTVYLCGRVEDISGN